MRSAAKDDSPAAWDGAAYDDVAEVQERWGRAVIGRNAWRGDEVVLDAGCGSGRLIAALLERIPHGRLVCLDRDGSMLEAARRRVQALAPQISVAVTGGDLKALEQTALAPESFDVVFSNAALHWIRNKQLAFAGMIRLMKPGARLTAQFGGQGNIQRIRAAIYRALRRLGLPTTYDEEFEFAAPEHTSEQLKICGFRNVRVWQEEATTEFPDRAAFLRFAEAVILRPLRTALPAERWPAFREEFARQAQALLGGWRVDYVRQNVEANR